MRDKITGKVTRVVVKGDIEYYGESYSDYLRRDIDKELTQYIIEQVRSGEKIIYIPPVEIVDDPTDDYRTFYNQYVKIEEIVRCKNCKYGDGVTCDYSAIFIRPNGFCHWGERRE